MYAEDETIHARGEVGPLYASFARTLRDVRPLSDLLRDQSVGRLHPLTLEKIIAEEAETMNTISVSTR